MNKGFTLIELLVVVLIIGILAAIALPQYTKAVERSRVAEAAQWLGDAATAQSIYYMQNNDFATSIGDGTAAGDLNGGDITIPTTLQNWSGPVLNNATAGQVTMTLTRNGGMYGTSTLAITVKNTGEISKSCTKNQDGFASIAKTAGYPTTGSCGNVATN